ncbi:MAG TPA: hypothetical protein VHE34_16855 [Puia sp.]|uniref:hypothetical protein n=1 Tax=Puia sp. TaxID=2045100 RepID=UPI002B760460|nr:hypothetical protein [Puia sp.]HVU96903.1 hypothetical protein [Puia sp.]
MASQIKYYPVDNGDMTIISIDEKGSTTNLLVDCNIRKSSKGGKIAEEFDVQADLLKILKRKTHNGIKDVPYVDVYILTHGDDDHLHGFKDNFYQGDPASYKQVNKDNNEILVEVLWFSPMVMGTATNDDERCFNKEARRRINLHCEKKGNRKDAGNRIVVIGDNGHEKLDDIDDLVRFFPGDVIKRFNDRDLTLFSIFIHSPYQKDLKDEEVDKNRVSLVFQARFHNTASKDGFAALIMFGGDSNYEAWKTIIEKTKKHGNEKKEHALEFDVFMAPHHCSWTFFGGDSDKDDGPAKSSLEALKYKRGTAKIVASCKEIKDNNDNPPHYRAYQEYVKAFKAENVLETAKYGKKGKTPQPIAFEVTQQGPVIAKKEEGNAAAAATGATSTVNKTSGYGSR